MKKHVWIAGEKERFANYARAVSAAGGIPCFSGAPERCDALLLPGGGDWEPWRYGQRNTASRNLDPERDALEMELLRQFTSAGKPVLGICRGMQSINVFFDGTLIQHMPGHSQIQGKDRLHTVYTAPGPLAAALSASGPITVNSAHHQAVAELGQGLRAEQWAADGVMEALRHETLPIWGIQWHPERLPGRMGIRLFRAFFTLCP